jgi:predicted nucleic acid-binding protein
MERLAPMVRACNIKLHFPEIDPGDSEAISLYKELNADYLLIDDKIARQVAESNYVNCIGTLGLLITAKQKKLIASLRLIFEQLLSHKRFTTKIFSIKYYLVKMSLCFEKNPIVQKQKSSNSKLLYYCIN